MRSNNGLSAAVLFADGHDSQQEDCVLQFRERARSTGCTFKRFKTTTRTNWHYECANAILEGTIHI
jgi:prepilin-type processing-associated H-X9-DG protein